MTRSSASAAQRERERERRACVSPTHRSATDDTAPQSSASLVSVREDGGTREAGEGGRGIERLIERRYDS